MKHTIDVGGFAPGGEMPRPHSVEVAADGSGTDAATEIAHLKADLKEAEAHHVEHHERENARGVAAIVAYVRSYESVREDGTTIYGPYQDAADMIADGIEARFGAAPFTSQAPEKKAGPGSSPDDDGQWLRLSLKEAALLRNTIMGDEHAGNRAACRDAFAKLDGFVTACWDAEEETPFTSQAPEKKAGPGSGDPDIVNRCFNAALAVVARDPDISTPAMRRITNALAEKAAEFTSAVASEKKT